MESDNVDYMSMRFFTSDEWAVWLQEAAVLL